MVDDGGWGLLGKYMWHVEGRWPGGTDIVCEDRGRCCDMGSLAGNKEMMVAMVTQGEAMHVESSRSFECRLCSAGLLTKC